MLVNLTDIFTSDEKNTTMEVTLEMNEVAFGNEKFPICEKSPIILSLQNEGNNKAVVHAGTKLAVLFQCDRCLKDVKYPFLLDFEVRVASPEIQDREEEQSFMDGYHLNVDDLIYNEMILNWPMKILCREDCKGICRVCGKDLNTGACGCDTFVPNPGLAGIKEIFNANKEV